MARDIFGSRVFRYKDADGKWQLSQTLYDGVMVAIDKLWPKRERLLSTKTEVASRVAHLLRRPSAFEVSCRAAEYRQGRAETDEASNKSDRGVIAVAAALDELNARITELRADLTFVALATQLRPRIGGFLQWQAAGEVLELARQFMEAKASRPEGLYGPLLVRLLAMFERYLRSLVAQCVERRQSQAPIYDNLSETIIRRNVVLTGRLFSTIDTPRDHLMLDIDSMISNLATCKRGNKLYRLNTKAFSATITGASPTAIDRALQCVDLSTCWDDVGGSTILAKQLQTKGARGTGEGARERLKELWRWRNHLAHCGDEEIALTDVQLRGAIDFVQSFSATLDVVVHKRLNGD